MKWGNTVSTCDWDKARFDAISPSITYRNCNVKERWVLLWFRAWGRGGGGALACNAALFLWHIYRRISTAVFSFCLWDTQKSLSSQQSHNAETRLNQHLTKINSTSSWRWKNLDSILQRLVYTRMLQVFFCVCFFLSFFFFYIFFGPFSSFVQDTISHFLYYARILWLLHCWHATSFSKHRGLCMLAGNWCKQVK